MIRLTSKMPALRLGLVATAAVLASLACGLPGPGDATPTPPAPEIPAGWICHTNETYGFEVCYPPDSTFTTESAEHSRIGLVFVEGTNLMEKWMDVDAREGLAECASPQAEGYSAGSVDESTQTINGMEFRIQSAEDAGAGNRWKWTGYSTEKDGVCASLTGVLHYGNPMMYSTPPPEFDLAAESAVFAQIVATFHWLEEETPEPEATVPPEWVCFQNALYAFEVCYPADATLSGETADHVRINLTIAPDTNLHEKWMDVDGRNIPPDCGSPQAAGYDPAGIDTSLGSFAGLEFRIQSASEGAAGSLYSWTGYSTERDGVCASLTGVLHSHNPGLYLTPPAEFDEAGESAVFEQIVNTFRWLDAATPTPSSEKGPTATLTANTNCRRGASTDHEIVTFLRDGQTAPIVGRNADGTWWLVQVPGTAVRCWVWGQLTETRGDLNGVPFVESPILGCWYQGPNDKRPKCVAPCPEGAKPGGVCEP
ncbi:MAG: hypothetical protein JW929_06725 [Anaerolineales bacterium]|nr:hypothetical protein [Anaerolineales bacterium]